MGLCYLDGDGVAKDYLEAVKWYSKADEQNNSYAQYELGLCYANGRGVAVDDMAAFQWWSKTAEQNNAKAQSALSALYLAGRGVAKDYVESYKWVLLAAAQGDKNAKKGLPIIENLMTREQIAEGQKLAHDFQSKAGCKYRRTIISRGGGTILVADIETFAPGAGHKRGFA
jgi:hypothetical protein